MGHSSLWTVRVAKAMSSIATNCGQDANQVSHELLREVGIPEGRALLLGGEEIGSERLESYAICKPGQSRLVVIPQQAARPGASGGRQAQEGERPSLPRKPRNTALRRSTPPAAAPSPSAREAALLASRFCRPSHTLLQERHFVLFSGSKTQSRRSLRTS